MGLVEHSVFKFLGVLLAPPQRLPRGGMRSKEGAQEHSLHAYTPSPQPLYFQPTRPRQQKRGINAEERMSSSFHTK